MLINGRLEPGNTERQVLVKRETEQPRPLATKGEVPVAKAGAPAWALWPFRLFLDQTEHLSQTMHLTRAGVSVLRAMPRAVEVLAQIDELAPPDGKRLTPEGVKNRLERATRDAEFAEREVTSDFPFLHAQAVVALWSYLEALTRTFVSAWMEHKPGAFAVPEVARLKIKVGEYENLPHEERCAFIFDLLEQELVTARREGVTRFEALLAPFDLSGPVPEQVGRAIFELGQIRNVLVHRGGVVDKRLAMACPWLDALPGTQLGVTSAMLGLYFEAVHKYIVILIDRVRMHFDPPAGHAFGNPS